MTAQPFAAASAAETPEEREGPSRRARAANDARDSLTRRASLGAVASLLDFGTQAGVGFVTAPILLSGLGRSLYGVWEIINRLVSHVVATDGRPTEALRLVVAQGQATAAGAAQRRLVGSAIAVWLLFLPAMLILGGVLMWLAPIIVRAGPGSAGAIRLACALLLVGTMLSTLAAIPESSLQGMNLGYKRMGLQASVNVVGGVLMVGALAAGLGLPGLAASRVAFFAMSGLLFVWLARRYVSWFGVARPTKAETRRLAGVSVWIAIGDTITRLLASSDIVILGAVMSPALVTTYVLTGYATKFLVGVATLGVGAAMPGLGGLLGSGRLDRAALSQREIVAAVWLVMTAGGGTILLWNRALLALWVGPGQDAGPLVGLLIVLAGVQTVAVRTYVFVIDAALRTPFRVRIGAIAAAGIVAGSIAGCLWLGLPGLCLGVLAGRVVQCVALPVFVRSRVLRGVAPRTPTSRALRAVTVTAGIFLGAAWLGSRVTAAHWVTWGVASIGTMMTLTLSAYVLGLDAEVRRALASRAAGVASLRLSAGRQP